MKQLFTFLVVTLLLLCLQSTLISQNPKPTIIPPQNTGPQGNPRNERIPEELAGRIMVLVSDRPGQKSQYAMTDYPNINFAYYIKSASGEKYLSVVKSENSDDLTLQVTTKKTAIDPSQVWTFSDYGDGKSSYFIKSGLGKSLHIDNRNNGQLNIKVLRENGIINQRWELVKDNKSNFVIQSNLDNRVLDSQGDGPLDNKLVSAYKLNGFVSQKWLLIPILTSNSWNASTSGEPIVLGGKQCTFFGDINLDSKTINKIPNSPAKQENWEIVNTANFGVAGKSRNGHFIKKNASGKDGIFTHFAGRNWYPLSSAKKTVCGNFKDFSLHDSSEESKELSFGGIGYTLNGERWSDEEDINIKIIPNPDFRYLIEPEIVSYNIEDKDKKRCSWGLKSITGEITPDDEFIAKMKDKAKTQENIWFDLSVGWSFQNGKWPPTVSPIKSLFLDKNVCIYGTWVREEIHCNRPEIHPVELFWSKPTEMDVQYLFIFQDDSDRFDDLSDFPDYVKGVLEIQKNPDPRKHAEKINQLKKQFTPWVNQTVSAEFYIPFELDLDSKTPLEYDLVIHSSRNIVSNNTKISGIPSKEFNGKRNRISYEGKDLLIVNKNLEDPTEIGIRFELFQKEGSKKILGFLVISSAVGKNTNGKEGYAAIVLSKHFKW